MEYSEGHVVGMTLHRLNTTLAEIVPNFDGLIIARSDDIWFVCTRVELNVVHALFMRLHGEIGGSRSQ